jgi:trehalose 6-phosphate synthase/phosphatase
LAETHGNDVYLISGRNSAWLEEHFGSIPINLVAEHGGIVKNIGGQWEYQLETHNEWKEQVYNIMDMYVRRCANSFIEEKEFSMVWHYRNANPEQGKLRANELVIDLKDYVHNRHLYAQMGNRIVEVRQSGINKGKLSKEILLQDQYDFIFAVGDDRTDEDMFKSLLFNENVFSIKVGPEASYAKFNLYTPQMVVSLLEGLSHVLKPVDQH